jgi:YidC/Oxa1 family membrane protein insertase
VGADIHKVSFGDLTKGDGSKGHRVFEGTLSWAAIASKYFLGAVVAAEPKPGFVRLGGDAGVAVQSFDAKLQMNRDRTSFVDYAVYLGPLRLENLEAYDQEPYQAQLSKLVDLGPAIFRPVASVTLSALELLYAVIPNWGLVIIIFSGLTKLLFYPLTKSSTQSMKRMQEVQPKLQKLREKFKDEPQRLNSEMLRIYREEKINPLGGCLPLLVQMPVFYALFTILRKTIELRQANFAWWMDDLSQPDALFQLPVSLPLFGSNVNLLPVLMAVGMWWQTKLSQPSNGAPSDGGAMAAQMRMMSTVMPLMMFVLFYNSPSGLVLYWLVNTVLTALQTWQIHSKMSPSPKTENPQPA